MTKLDLLREIFGHDFSGFKDAESFRIEFFNKKLTLNELLLMHQFIADCQLELAGKNIATAVLLKNAGAVTPPFMLIAQMHGNEPAGLAGILYALALSAAGLLKRQVIAVIGNDLAAKQYFAALAKEPRKKQEARDVYRRGVDANEVPLPDMNRIPNNFRSLAPSSSHEAARWQELDLIADNVNGILDIHTARGNMICLTESSNHNLLVDSPIRNILEGLTEAIGAATDSSTFKTVAGVKPNIKYQFGIEAGTHEDENSYARAAEFTAALLYNIGVSKVKPIARQGKFKQYKVGKALKFSDLKASTEIGADEKFYTAKVVNGKPQVYQYEEFEEILEGQVVAVSQPSGVELRAPFKFSTLFITKSAEVYADKAIGLYPVAASEMNIKFSYPCDVTEIDI